jgi:DNA-directed RNA polymerase specialized sigma subunit
MDSGDIADENGIIRSSGRIAGTRKLRKSIVAEKVQLKIEKSKIYKNLDILDDREKEVVVGRFGLEHGGEERK